MYAMEFQKLGAAKINTIREKHLEVVLLESLCVYCKQFLLLTLGCGNPEHRLVALAGYA